MKNKYLFRFFPYPGIETVCWENWDFERQQLTLPDGRKVCLDNIQAAFVRYCYRKQCERQQHAPHMGDRIFQTFKVKTV